MINVRDIYSFSSTAQAAYGTLDVTKNSLEDNLALGVDKDPLLSETQAKEFCNWMAYGRNGHMQDQTGGRAENGGGGGFSATLFQRNSVIKITY